MNRFRRKSEAAKRTRRDGDSSPTSPGPPSLVLPELGAFRTSLILPHLTRRFSLLRGEDGKLVSLDQMEHHLAAQQSTGRLTAYEVDAVRMQYRLQSMYESPDQAMPHSAPAWHHQPGSSHLKSGWNAPDDSDVGQASSHASYISRATTSSYGPEAPSPNPSSAAPFPYALDLDLAAHPPALYDTSLSPSQVSLSSTPTASASGPSQQGTPTIRRGGNSMFGGRVPDLSSMRLPKSTSSTSIHSHKSAKMQRDATAGSGDQADDEGATATTTTTTDLYSDRGDAGHDRASTSFSLDRRGSDVSSIASSSAGGTDLPYVLPELTPKQVNRISRVLGDIASELKLPTYVATTLDEDEDEDQEEEKEELEEARLVREEGPISPVSDTEPVDVRLVIPIALGEQRDLTLFDFQPYFHRLPTISLNAARRVSKSRAITPSGNTSSGRSTPHAAPLETYFSTSSTSLVSSTPASRKPSVASLPQTIDEQEVLVADPVASTSARPFSPDLSTRKGSVKSPISTAIPFSDPFAPIRKRDTSAESSESAFSPIANAFPNVPHDPSDPGQSSSRESILSRSGSKGASILSRSNSNALSRSNSTALSRSNSKAQSSSAGRRGRRAYAATSASTDPSSTMFSPAMNGSTSSLGSGSIGSSYHAEQFDGDSGDDHDVGLKSFDNGDDEEVLPSDDADADPGDYGRDRDRWSKFSRSGTGTSALQTLCAPPTSCDMDRRPSDELLKEIIDEANGAAGSDSAHSEGGQADLVLQDLVLIQDTLVRSASRRAEATRLDASTSSVGSGTSENIILDGTLGRDASDGNSPEGHRDSDEPSPAEARDSVPPPDQKARPSPSKRPSIDSSGSPNSFVTSSQMTPQTSSSGTDNVDASPSTVHTPSTLPSDAFEYSSLIRSSGHDNWEDEKEHLRDPATFADIATLDAPIDLDNPAMPRIPRAVAPRRTAATQSVLIRDVRDQATLATMALKNGALSSPKAGLTRFKSVRNAAISRPQLISGPVEMPTFDIPVPPEPEAGGSPKPTRSKSGKGSRFKMLLKKQSRDRLHLTGEEVTPFVDSAPVPVPSAIPLFTPPDQHVAKFASASGDGPVTPESHGTPDSYPRKSSVSSCRSPALRQDEEAYDNVSPSHSQPAASPSNGGTGISRLVSRFRRPRQGSDAATRSNLSSPSAASPSASPHVSRRPSMQDENTSHSSVTLNYGLGIAGTDGGRAPVTYDIGARRRQRTATNDSGPEPPATAPLQLRSPQPLDFSNLSNKLDPTPTVRSAPLFGTEEAAARPASISSTASRKQLWEAAQELGMPTQEARELVDLSYAQSPTSSTGHRPNGSSASGSTLAGSVRLPRAASDASTPPFGGSLDTSSGHTRGASESSTRSRKSPGHRRVVSNQSTSPRPKSFHDRSSTPPPSSTHRRKASQSSVAQAGAVPDLPHSSSGSSRSSPTSARPKHLSVDRVSEMRRQSRLSAGTNGSYGLRPPLSPSVSSYRSSEYAGSLFDMYDYDNGEGGEPGEADDSLGPISDVAEDAMWDTDATANHNDESTAMGMPSSPQVEVGDGELVWKVVDDLKNHRVSTGSYSFHSRQSSTDSSVSDMTSPPPPLAAGGPLSRLSRGPAGDLLHIQGNRRTATLAPHAAPENRYPSVFLRDEKRLLEIAKEHNGVAHAEEGNFLVRSPQAPEDSQGP